MCCKVIVALFTGNGRGRYQVLDIEDEPPRVIQVEELPTLGVQANWQLRKYPDRHNPDSDLVWGVWDTC